MKRPPNILVVGKPEAAAAQRGSPMLMASMDYIVETDDDSFTILKNKVGETDGPHPIGILPVWLASRFT